MMPLMRPAPYTLLLTLALAVFAAPAMAGDPQAGQDLSATCAACHGQDGKSIMPMYPVIAGQYEDYLVHALQGYRSGARRNAIMAGFAAQLSDDDIDNLAAYYASLPGPLAVLQDN